MKGFHSSWAISKIKIGDMAFLVLMVSCLQKNLSKLEFATVGNLLGLYRAVVRVSWIETVKCFEWEKRSMKK